jgi:hypothetical protein
MPIFFLLYPLLSFSNVTLNEVTTTDKISYSFKAVCSKMVSHESPLIEVISASELDCMGKKIAVTDFCEKERSADPYYLRAYVDQNLKKVICHSGKKVIFKYQCVKLTDKKYCEQDPKLSCGEIKNKMAKRLGIVHASVTKNEKGIKELNCYFESQTFQ